MGEGFLVQFLAVAWRFILLIVVAIGLAIFAIYRQRQKEKEARRTKKEEIRNTDSTPQQRSRRQRASQQTQTPQSMPSDDPLAELYAVREEAKQSGEASLLASVSEAVETPSEDEIVELASLLTTMAESPKTYHQIAEQAVAVKLVTKRIAIADELLTILRDERDKRLMVQIGEPAYRTLQDDVTVRQSFARLMKELSNVILVEDAHSPENAELNGERPNKMVSASVDVPVSSGGDTQAREMMSVLRDTADGRLIVQIGNTGYRSLVGHDKARAGFARVMKDLAKSVSTPDDNPPAVPQAPKTETSPQEPLPPFGSPIMSSHEDSNAPLPGDIRMPSMDEMPDSYSVGRFGRVRVKKIKQSERMEEISIADAIEEYLQYKLSMTPHFQSRNIHIRSGFGGGVRIDVDGKTYEFVDEIEDKEAQAFIKQAIDEWQERH